MYLHEFQAKNIFKKKHISVPKSFLVKQIDEIKNIKNNINCNKIVLKAQVHTGARGKFGGIKIINNSYEECEKEIKNMLHKKLITNQTGEDGKTINYVLVEEYINIDKEFYLSFYIDRQIESTVLMISKSGGADIEKNDEQNFLKLEIDLDYGIFDYQIRNIIFFLNVPYNYFEKTKFLIENLFYIFKENDLILLEINPLILHNENFYCLDAKIEIDDNAFYRQKDLFNDYDYDQDTKIEIEAKKKI